jgi:acyl-CoA thioester hydrolase
VVQRPAAIPEGAEASVLHHRVAFFETDAMRIVHHANYVRYLELARIVFMDEHDAPYRSYVERDLHFATTLVEVRYLRSAAFDDQLEVWIWLEWVRRASLRMAYLVQHEGELLARAAPAHAMVDGTGRLTRIPPERRTNRAAIAPG